MSRLRIHNDNEGSWGTLVELDGKEIPFVRGIDLHVHVSDPVTAKVELVAANGFDVSLDALVNVHIETVPGCDIEETQLPDGGKRYRAVPR